MAAQRGTYTVVFSGATIASASGDYDFFELTAAAATPIEIVALSLSNKSEIAAGQEEQVDLRIIRGNATTGNGTATTPRPLDPADPAASFTAETVGSTPASAGTPLELFSENFNIFAGDIWLFPEALRIKTTNAAGLLCVRLSTALNDDAVMSGTLWVREL